MTKILLLFLALSASAQIQIPREAWTVETSAKTSDRRLDLVYGETRDLECRFLSYQRPMDIAGATVILHARTNGMVEGSSFQASGSASSNGLALVRLSTDAWLPQNLTACTYTLEVSQTNAARILRSSGTCYLTGSSAGSSNSPLPTIWATNFSSRLSSVEASASANAAAIVHLVSTQQLNDALSSIQILVGSDSALRLASPYTNWWVSVAGGTSTLWHVRNEWGWLLSIPTPGIETTITNLPEPSLWLTAPYAPNNYIFSAYGYTLEISESNDTHTFVLYDANGDYYETSGICVDGSETDGVAVSNIVIFSTHELPSATLTYLGAGPTTNRVGRYIREDEFDEALSTASRALQLASNAMAAAESTVFSSISLSGTSTNTVITLYWNPTNGTIVAQEVLP